jgi:predicted nucleic acid-binding protein
MDQGGQVVVVVTDTSVLVNFLCIDRMDLIGAHAFDFVITDHVAAEIMDHYPEQQERLSAALQAGIIRQESVTSDQALNIFKELSETKRLGAGESAAIALAVANGYAIAIDDRTAAKNARRVKSDLVIVGTQEIMVDLIRAGRVEVAEADRIKETWARDHSFALVFASFNDIL